MAFVGIVNLLVLLCYADTAICLTIRDAMNAYDANVNNPTD